jgi:uncharacterized membrane protein YfcA
MIDEAPLLGATFREPDVRSTPPVRPAVLFLSGSAIAFVGSMCGIGGGLFAVPLLHFGLRFELRRAVATALALVFATGTTATVVEALRADSELRWGLLAVLFPGALVGAQVGFRVARRLRTDWLRAVFVVALSAAGVRLLLGNGAVAGDVPLADPEGLEAVLIGLAIGFGGGFVAPLLGIGGGLLFVPALFFAVPSLGFAGARACSLATSIAASSRSLWLYLRAGDVARTHAAWLAAGAAVGAAAGVWTVHAPGVTAFGRITLGVVLLVVAARFLRDLVRRQA